MKLITYTQAMRIHLYVHDLKESCDMLRDNSDLSEDLTIDDFSYITEEHRLEHSEMYLKRIEEQHALLGNYLEELKELTK